MKQQTVYAIGYLIFFSFGGLFTYIAGTIYHKYECLNPEYQEASHLQVVHSECMELQSLSVCNKRLGVE